MKLKNMQNYYSLQVLIYQKTIHLITHKVNCRMVIFSFNHHLLTSTSIKKDKKHNHLKDAYFQKYVLQENDFTKIQNECFRLKTKKSNIYVRLYFAPPQRLELWTL